MRTDYEETEERIYFLYDKIVDNQDWEISELDELLDLFRKDGIEWQAKQSPWISVVDRLPDFKDGLFNVRCKNKNKEDGIWLYDICYIDEDTNTWGKRHHTWETITHWMPIPE